MMEEPMLADYGGGCGSYGGCGSLRRLAAAAFGDAPSICVWWVRGANTPPLVTTSPDGTPVGIAGVLPNATILFGNDRINTQARSGGRFTLGYFCDPCQQLGIEDTFFFVGNGDEGFFASSSGSPILARPFFNTETDGPGRPAAGLSANRRWARSTSLRTGRSRRTKSICGAAL